MYSERIKTCVISAPLETDTRLIRDALIQRDIRVLDFGELSTGSSWQASIIATITRADLVIGVLTHRDSANTMFELGVAVGHGKPLLIFAPAKGDLLPSNLAGFQVVRTGLRNREAIDFALDQIMASPSGPTRADNPRSASFSTRTVESKSYRPRLAQILHDRNGRELESLVAQLLRESGAEVVAEADARDGGVDLVVWSDGLEAFVDNPFPIEVKARLVSRDDAKRALSQTAKSASAIGARWSMLLYGEGPTSANRVWQSSPTVFALSIEELLVSLESMSFPEIIRTLRNRRAHGLDD